MEKSEKFNSIDEYISQFPDETKKILETLRKTIRDIAKDAKEKISYSMPTFFLNGNLVHFAAYKKHIGFYPGSEAIKVFKDRLSNYKISTGTIQFPIDTPLPYELIIEIVKFRVDANIKKREDSCIFIDK